MPETTYLSQVRCEISEGLTGSDKTICVRDVDGRRQYIHVLPSLVNWVSDTPYLPVGVINVITVTIGSSSSCLSRRIPARTGCGCRSTPSGSSRECLHEV